MAQYRIVGSYKVYDVEPNPDVVVGQAAGNNSYNFSCATADELKALILANAAALVNSSAADAATKAAALAAISGEEE